MRKWLSKLTIFLSVLLIFTIIVLQNYGLISVKYVGCIDMCIEINQPSFNATYNVQSLIQDINTGTLNDVLADTDSILNKLNKLPNEQRIVISFGQELMYFYYHKKSDQPIRLVHEVYKEAEVENKIYIYTTNYTGAIIDYLNY